MSFFLDIFKLENELPEELLGGTDTQNNISNGPSIPSGVAAPKSMVQSQLHSPFSNSVGVSIPTHNQLISPTSITPTPRPPSVQSHKQISQLLQPGRNSPKYSGNTSSPGNAGVGSPHPSRQPSQPLPSPATNLQSPNAGSIIGNIKSPVSASTAVLISRASGNNRTTPSPRGFSSLAMSSSINTPSHSLQGNTMLGRNVHSSGLNQPVGQHHVATNGTIQPQVQLVQQNVQQNHSGLSPAMPSNMSNISGLSGNYSRNTNSSGMVVAILLFIGIE